MLTELLWPEYLEITCVKSTFLTLGLDEKTAYVPKDLWVFRTKGYSDVSLLPTYLLKSVGIPPPFAGVIASRNDRSFCFKYLADLIDKYGSHLRNRTNLS